MGRPDADEHSPVCGSRRTATAQIADHRFTNVGRQRQSLDLVALAANDDRASSPIDVVEPKTSELTRT